MVSIHRPRVFDTVVMARERFHCFEMDIDSFPTQIQTKSYAAIV